MVEDDDQTFYDCCECDGARGCPRNGAGGATCTAGACKKGYAMKRKETVLPVQIQPSQPASAAHAETMPEHMYVAELKKILGERCCEPRKLPPEQRRGGPRRSFYSQQYLVLGTFLENTRDDDDSDAEYEETNEPSMYWVNESDLFHLDRAAVDEKIEERHEKVTADRAAAWPTPKKRSRRRS